MVRKYKDSELLKKVQELPSFKYIPVGFWILGVRSNEDMPDKFDDKFYLYEGETFHCVVSGTTNPAISILGGGFKKYNKDGAAIVKSDEWYYNVWQYGLHKGMMPALLQTGAKILVHRDGDMDNKSEERGTAKAGFYGINFHANSYDLDNMRIATDIKGWSAGCQVINNMPKYIEIIKKCKNQDKITYCLLNEFVPM